jgi:hypothetical protein
MKARRFLIASGSWQRCLVAVSVGIELAERLPLVADGATNVLRALRGDPGRYAATDFLKAAWGPFESQVRPLDDLCAGRRFDGLFLDADLPPGADGFRWESPLMRVLKSPLLGDLPVVVCTRGALSMALRERLSHVPVVDMAADSRERWANAWRIMRDRFPSEK